HRVAHGLAARIEAERVEWIRTRHVQNEEFTAENAENAETFEIWTESPPRSLRSLRCNPIWFHRLKVTVTPASQTEPPPVICGYPIFEICVPGWSDTSSCKPHAWFDAGQSALVATRFVNVRSKTTCVITWTSMRSGCGRSLGSTNPAPAARITLSPSRRLVSPGWSGIAEGSKPAPARRRRAQRSRSSARHSAPARTL